MKNTASTGFDNIPSPVFSNQLFQQTGNNLLPHTTGIISDILKKDLRQQGYEFLLQLKYLSPQAEISLQKLLTNDQFKTQLFSLCRLLYVPESWLNDVQNNLLPIQRFFEKIHRFIGHVAYSFFSKGMTPPHEAKEGENPYPDEEYPEFYATIYNLEYQRLQKYQLGRFTVVKSGGIVFKNNQHRIISKQQYSTAQASSVHPASLGYGQDPYDPTGERMGTGGKYRLDAVQMLLSPTNQSTIITTGSFATPEEEKLGSNITGSYAETYGERLKKNLTKHRRNLPQILYANLPTSHNTFAEIVNRLKVIYDQIHEHSSQSEKVTLSVISNTYHLARLKTMIHIILYNSSTPTDKKCQKYIQDLGGPRNAMFANCKATKHIDLQNVLTNEQYAYLAEHLDITLIPAEEVLAATNFHVSYHPESAHSLTVGGYKHDAYQEMVALEKKGEQQLQNCTYWMPPTSKQKYGIE